MRKIEIYDPPMCCSSGVCGTQVDEKLVEFAGVLKILANSGIIVERFNMSQQPEVFVKNARVKQLLGEKGQAALPLVFVDDELQWSGELPAAKELLKVFGIEHTIKENNTGGCCGGGGGCCG